MFVAGALLAGDVALPDLFKRAKDKFAAGDYKSSLADFDQLDAMSAGPGFEKDRAKLLPVVTFYRGANLAALGQQNEAKEAFVTYLGLVPTAAIASPPFPKATVDLFEAARKAAAGRSTTMAGLYAAFTPPNGWKLAPDVLWIESPVRYLLTPAQRKEYSTFTSDAERATFIEAFWRQLDPTPTTDENEMRNEFERRVAFADSNFNTPKQLGRFTERAVIFTFLGAPTYVGVARMSDDSMGALRAVGNDPIAKGTTNVVTNPGSGKGGSRNTIFSEVEHRTKQDNLETDTTRGKRESWYYRRDRLPQNVRFQEVHFDFITKEGYGSDVMQKDSDPMLTLGKAVEIARAEKRLP
jgi:GWxTD domain-containing protein